MLTRTIPGASTLRAQLPVDLPHEPPLAWFIIPPFCFLNPLRGFMAEGAGFEPAVGYPTFDFESSALNRTQPPFLVGEAIHYGIYFYFLFLPADSSTRKKNPLFRRLR